MRLDTLNGNLLNVRGTKISGHYNIWALKYLTQVLEYRTLKLKRRQDALLPQVYKVQLVQWYTLDYSGALVQSRASIYSGDLVQSLDESKDAPAAYAQ